MGPSRKFKENFVVTGCFLFSLVIIIVTLACLRLWWFLSLAVILFLFFSFQGAIFNIFRKR